MMNQDAPPDPKVNDSPSSTSSHLYSALGFNPYMTPTPWTMETMAQFNAHRADQETVDGSDSFWSEPRIADYFSPLLESSSSLLSPTFDTSLDLLSPPLQETIEQLPTPPELERGQESPKVLSISTAFNDGRFLGLIPPDIVLVSSDETLFYVHGTVLSGSSFFQAVANLHSGPLAASAMSLTLYPCPLPHHINKIWVKMNHIIADELNIVLHALYDVSCANFQPTFDTIERAIDKMASLFDLVVNVVIRPGKEMHIYLSTITPLQPLRVYALAAHHKIHGLAVNASAHLLSYPLEAISDEESERIGGIYLRKLCLLQNGRKERLIELLISPPRPHPSVPGCGLHEQKAVKGLWTGALVKLIHNLRADVSSTMLQKTFEPLKAQLSCPRCVEMHQAKLNEALRAWVSIKHTI